MKTLLAFLILLPAILFAAPAVTPINRGVLQTHLDANGKRITNAANPSAAQDLATKAYVDANIGSGGNPATNLNVYTSDNDPSPTGGGIVIIPLEKNANPGGAALLLEAQPPYNPGAWFKGKYRFVSSVATNTHGSTNMDVIFADGYNFSGNNAGVSSFGATDTNQPSYVRQRESHWQNGAGLTQLEYHETMGTPYTIWGTNFSWRWFSANLVWNDLTKEFYSSDGNLQLGRFDIRNPRGSGLYGVLWEAASPFSRSYNQTLHGKLTTTTNDVGNGGVDVQGGELSVGSSSAVNRKVNQFLDWQNAVFGLGTNYFFVYPNAGNLIYNIGSQVAANSFMQINLWTNTDVRGDITATNLIVRTSITGSGNSQFNLTNVNKVVLRNGSFIVELADGTDQIAVSVSGGVTLSDVTATTLATADGSGIAALNADNIAAGTVADARIPSGITRDSEIDGQSEQDALGIVTKTAAQIVSGDKEFTGNNVFSHIRRLKVDLAGGTALTVGRDYWDTFTANRTLTFSGTPAEGSVILLHADVTTECTLTIPTSELDGGDGSTVTSVLLPVGYHNLCWIYVNAEWVLSGAPIASSGGAPTDADYLVGTANGSLSAEIVVGTTPGGELGGTWGSPTLDDNLTVDGWAMGTFTGTTLTLTNQLNIEPDGTVQWLINRESDTLRIFEDVNDTAFSFNLSGLFTAPSVSVDGEAYDATGWNGDTTVPQKDAIRDKIESLTAANIAIADTGAIFTATQIEAALLELAKVPVAIKSSAYTIGTDDPRECYGGLIIVTSAATITGPTTVVAGMSWTIKANVAGAVVFNPETGNSDTITLDGTALSAGDSITSTSTLGDVAVFVATTANALDVTSNGWTDTN